MARNEYPFQHYLRNLHRQLSDIKEGDIADYIPELAKVEPDLFGICLVNNDGSIQQVGDTNYQFTLQSISKPFVYGLVLEDVGIDRLKTKINTEPSGDAFNSISLEPETGRPLNPMINAGAIAATSCVIGNDLDDRLDRILTSLSRYAGRKLNIDQSVFQSECSTGHRNRAIAHMLRNFDVIEEKIEESLNLYFSQCSTLVTCVDLAVMAATLANDGINPLTKERAVSSQYVPLILSVMSLCGMYDYSGRWIYNIGLPAKSGVGGGIITVLPGHFGLAVFSPRLDPRGNSVRGVKVCKQVSTDFNLHLLRIPKVALSILRNKYNVAEVRSKRVRSESDNSVLIEYGKLVKIFELQGELRFSSAETATRAIYDELEESQCIIIDFKHIFGLDHGASKILACLFDQVSKQKTCQLIITHSYHLSLDRFFEKNCLNKVEIFDELDRALEYAENCLIDVYSVTRNYKEIVFEKNELCAGFSENQLKALKHRACLVRHKKGNKVITLGDPSDSVFFIISGEVSVNLHKTGNFYSNRVATFSEGMFFGELAFLGQDSRTADIIADTDVTLRELTLEDLSILCNKNPEFKSILLENIAKRLAKNLLLANLEILALSK